MLTYSYIEGIFRTAVVPTATWKPAFTSNASEIPHGISPDGKKLFLMEYQGINEKGEQKTQMSIYDVKTKERTAIATPSECLGTMAYSFGSDGKHVAFVGFKREQVTNGFNITYKLYICNIDGTGLKMLFETKPGDYISDIDWR